MMEWALAYLTYQRNARIILVPRELKPRRKTPELAPGVERRGQAAGKRKAALDRPVA